MTEQAARRILVIDDETTHRILAKEYLQDAGYVVRLADDGIRGLNMAKRLNPDLIIVDLLVPGVDGFGLCRALKSSAPTKETPIILITAAREPDVIAQGFEAGADDFVTKPVDWNFLADRVAHVLAKAEEKRRLLKETELMMRKLEVAPGEATLGSHASSEAADPNAASFDQDARVQAARQSAEADMQAMELRHAAQIEALQNALSAAQSTASRELEAERARHGQELDALLASHRAETESREREAASTIQFHAAATAELRESLECQSKELAASRAEATEHAEEMLRSLSKQHAAQVRELREQADARFKALKIAMLDETQTRAVTHEQKVRELERTIEGLHAELCDARHALEMGAAQRANACWSFVRAATSVYINQTRTISSLIDSAASAADGSRPYLAEISPILKAHGSSLGSLRILSLILSGKSALQETVFDLRQLVLETIEQIGDLAKANRISVATQAPSDVVIVFADQARIRISLLSLLLNAVRHSPAGTAVLVCLDSDPQSGVTIRVEDKGLGIAPAQLHSLRTCLDSATAAASEEKVGFGIPVSTAVARVHGGGFELESNLGSGTSAIFRLPATRLRSSGASLPLRAMAG